MNRLATLFLCVLTSAAAACGSSDPTGTPDAAGNAFDAASAPDAAPQSDAAVACQPLATDYMPRDNMSADDMWTACISDDNAYHTFNDTISSIARVAGFEAIAPKLFTGSAPSMQDFIDARLTYLENNGLDSRISRREDVHYPAAAQRCRDLTAAEQMASADRCAGPAKIQPILLAAFEAGSMGTEPRLNAARIEAALLWFLYLSPIKESTTCTDASKDCDSAYAYYTGGQDRSAGLGLSRYIRTRSQSTHDRVWDGILAVRCWRDLDNPTGVATDLTTRDRAIAQLDRALMHGVAQIVRDRASQLATATAADRDVAWAFLQVLGPVLDREAGERDAANAAVLAAEWAKTDSSTVDSAALITALDTIFDCP